MPRQMDHANGDQILRGERGQQTCSRTLYGVRVAPCPGEGRVSKLRWRPGEQTRAPVKGAATDPPRSPVEGRAEQPTFVLADSVDIRQALHFATISLSSIEDPQSAKLEAEVLLRHVLDLTRAQLYTRLDNPLSEEQRGIYATLIERRLAREPVAYITGTKEFYGLDFFVDRRVLIPRPETELIVEKALEWLALHDEPEGGWLIADIGIGSGAIAVSLAVHAPNAKIIGVDTSSQALEVAALNCRRHHVEDRVILRRGDLLEGVPERLDLIVANLPYVTKEELASLSPDIREYEPVSALDGGDDGLDLYRRLLAEAPRRLHKNGHLLAEIGASQGVAIAEMARLAFPHATVELARDLAGLERVLVVANG